MTYGKKKEGRKGKKLKWTNLDFSIAGTKSAGKRCQTGSHKTGRWNRLKKPGYDKRDLIRQRGGKNRGDSAELKKVELWPCMR